MIIVFVEGRGQQSKGKCIQPYQTDKIAQVKKSLLTAKLTIAKNKENTYNENR